MTCTIDHDGEGAMDAQKMFPHLAKLVWMSGMTEGHTRESSSALQTKELESKEMAKLFDGIAKGCLKFKITK